MRHICTPYTDLDELIGRESYKDGTMGFSYGPIPQALMRDEELVLENSSALSITMVAKIRILVCGLFIPETEELMHPGHGFSLVLH